MLNNRSAIIAISLTLWLPISSHIGANQSFFTGNSVQQLSEGNRLFFISGMIQMAHLMNESEGSTFEKKICYPDGVDDYQLNQVVQKYLSANPEKLHWPAASLTWNALLKAFPCR